MKSKKLSFFLILFSVFSLFFVVFFFVFSSFIESKNLEKKEELLYEVINQANQTIIEKTTNYLMPAILIAETSSGLAKSNAINVNDFAKFEDYALNVIKPHRQLAKFYYASKDGQFVMVYRDEDKSISTKIVNPRTKATLIKKRNSFGAVLESNRSKSDYDPRVRPWFIGAKETEQRFWTDIYIFYTGKRPGITASFPAYDENNDFSGVFAVDIELEKIADYLKAQLTFDDAKIYVVNHKNQVVAQPDNISFKSLPNGSVEPLHMDALTKDPLSKAIRYYEEFDSEKFNVKHNGKRFIASIRKFPDYLGKEWKIVILVPEKEIVFSPMNLNKPYYAFLVLVLLGILGVSFILAKLFALPINLLTKDILRLLHNNLDNKVKSSSIVEVNDCIDAYKQLKERITKNNS